MADETMRNLYDGVRIDEIEKAMIFAAKSRIELDPAYGYVTARLLLEVIYRETLPGFEHYHDITVAHASRFKAYLEEGIAADRLTPRLLEFDLEKIAAALKPGSGRVLFRDYASGDLAQVTFKSRKGVQTGGAGPRARPNRGEEGAWRTQGPAEARGMHPCG